MKKQIAAAAIITGMFATQLQAQSPAQRVKNFNLSEGTAISGYDPVSYFSGKPEKGTPNITAGYQGVTYRFANQADKAAFLKNPSAYEPQYGGWCAYAMGAKGAKVEVDPETYKILNGKLYLFYNKYFNNTLKSWNKDEASLKNKADANWQKISH
ncbi:YHS domain-containing (seleno)protein [Chitinophagaceae bacterium MMS25-I14]